MHPLSRLWTRTLHRLCLGLDYISLAFEHLTTMVMSIPHEELRD